MGKIRSKKVIILILLLLSVAGGGGWYYFNRYRLRDEQKGYLACPVPKEFCEKAELTFGGSHLGFRLPAGTKIKAVFDGPLLKMRNPLQDVYFRLGNPPEISVAYVFRSEDYISIGDSPTPVTKGTLIGTSGEESRDYGEGYNLIIWVLREDGTIHPFPKEVFGIL